MATGGLAGPEVAPEDRPRVAFDYRERGDRLRRNFDLMVDEGAFDKASECLWGWYSAYTNALAIIRAGTILRTHGETEDYAALLAAEFQDRLSEMAIPAARNMHRNFYHGGPRSKDEFIEPLARISRYIQLVDERIRKEAAEGVAPGATRPRPRRRRKQPSAERR